MKFEKTIYFKPPQIIIIGLETIHAISAFAYTRRFSVYKLKIFPDSVWFVFVSDKQCSKKIK